jgi:hypothetical protein
MTDLNTYTNTSESQQPPDQVSECSDDVSTQIDHPLSQSPTAISKVEENNKSIAPPEKLTPEILPANDKTLLKQEKIDQIMRLKADISRLVSNVRQTKAICERYENENQYLQDYVGSLMKSGNLN